MTTYTLHGYRYSGSNVVQASLEFMLPDSAKTFTHESDGSYFIYPLVDLDFGPSNDRMETPYYMAFDGSVDVASSSTFELVATISQGVHAGKVFYGYVDSGLSEWSLFQLSGAPIKLDTQADLDQAYADLGGKNIQNNLSFTLPAGYGTDEDIQLSGIPGITMTEADVFDTAASGLIDPVIYSGVKADILTGADGSVDTFNGGKGKDKLYGLGDDDVLYGNAGNDKIYGGKGNDDLYGGKDNDVLKGGKGKDWLEGGGGDDKLTGGNKLDRFVFGKNDGNDKILDFENDVDRLLLSDALWQNDLNRAKVLRKFAVEQDGDVFFDFGDKGTLLVLDITEAELKDDMVI